MACKGCGGKKSAPPSKGGTQAYVAQRTTNLGGASTSRRKKARVVSKRSVGRRGW